MENEELEETNSVEINNGETVAKSGLYLKLGDIIETVSYTHLTLPTILRV